MRVRKIENDSEREREREGREARVEQGGGGRVLTYLRLADGDGVVALRDVLHSRPVQCLRLEKDARVGVANTREQQSLCLRRRPREHDLATNARPNDSNA